MNTVLRVLGIGTFAVLGSLAACSHYGSDCNNNQDCQPYPGGSSGNGTAGSSNSAGTSGGSGGTSGRDSSAGSSAAGGNASGSGGAQAGTSNAGAPAAGAPEGGEGGAGGSAPCDGACDGLKPICDLTTNTCVECTDKTNCNAPKPACNAVTNTCVECTETPDCKDSTKPFCDKTAERCVACLKQADCTAPTASACNAGACVACTKDTECSDIAGKGVCNAGTCVQCTVAKESVCAGKSCNPSTNQCTSTSVGTAQFCQACVADSECIAGNLPDPDARCVPMKFMGTARLGGFCLKRVTKTCSPPFGVPISIGSLSGAPSEAYCGIDQNSTRCEAVLDLIASKSCPDGLDTTCGCTRHKAGTCIDAGQGGLCKTVGAFSNACTIPCAATNQCLSTLTCPAVSNSYCQ